MSDDLEKQLEQRQAELEAERTREVAEAVEAGKKQQLAERLERERQAGIVAIESIIEKSSARFIVQPAKLYELLFKNDLPASEDGLAQLVEKFPTLADARTTKKLTGDRPEPKPKAKTPADFPACKSEFKSVEDKNTYIAEFGYDSWAALPMYSATRKDIEQLTLQEFNRLTVLQKQAINTELIAKNDDMGSYIERIRKNRPAA